MSSRKRNKRTPSKAEGPDETATDAAATDEAGTAAADDDAADAESAASPTAALRAEQSDDDAPLVSEISELRPREPDVSRDEIDQDLESDVAEDADQAPPVAATRAHLKRVIESLIFVSDSIISAQQIGRIVKTKQAEVRELVAELSVDYEGRGIELVEVSGGFQFRSAAASAPFVRDLVAARPARLTRAQLETLALIAYRQPITRPEIDDVRGVDSGSALKVLLDRDLLKILGRKDEAGRPLLYGTAPYFLEFFGMNSMQDLPTLKEFTELSDEHKDLFQRKTGDIPDLSAESETPSVLRDARADAEADAEADPDAAVVEDGDAVAEPDDLAAAYVDVVTAAGDAAGESSLDDLVSADTEDDDGDVVDSESHEAGQRDEGDVVDSESHEAEPSDEGDVVEAVHDDDGSDHDHDHDHDEEQSVVAEHDEEVAEHEDADDKPA